MTVRLQVHSLFSLSTFFPDPFPLVVSILSLPPPNALLLQRSRENDEQAFRSNCYLLLLQCSHETTKFTLKSFDTIVKIDWNSSQCGKCNML